MTSLTGPSVFTVSLAVQLSMHVEVVLASKSGFRQDIGYWINNNKNNNSYYVCLQKSGREMNKLNHLLQADEIHAALSPVTTEQRMAYLQKEFEDAVDQYRKILDRLQIS